MSFILRCFHHSTSQKMRVSTICTPAPPRPNCKKKHGKNKKKPKVQTHVPCQASPQTLSMGLIFCFFCFLEVLSKLQKTMEKTRNKKKQKVQTHVPCQASPQTLSMGLIFLFVFPLFFGMSFILRCFHHSTSQKMRVSTICTPAPPRPNCKKKHGKNN